MLTPGLMIFLWAQPLFAQPAGSTANELALQIYTHSSISATVSQTAGQIDEVLAQSAGEYEADEHARLSRIMKGAFREEDLRNDVLTSLAIGLPEDTARAVVAWLQSPLASRMLEMEAGMHHDDTAMAAYVQGLDMEDDATIERVQVVQSLLEAMGGAEVMVDMIASMMRAMIIAGQEVVDDAEAISPEQIDAQITLMKARMLPQFEPAIVVMMLYAYRDATTDELKEYASYYNTPEGAWYNRATSAALKHAFEQVGVRIGSQLDD